LVTSQSSRLARPGEAGDSAIPKRLIWEALRDCKDAQLYTADASVVDLGLIYDIQVRGSAVHVVMAMPHSGHLASLAPKAVGCMGQAYMAVPMAPAFFAGVRAILHLLHTSPFLPVISGCMGQLYTGSVAAAVVAVCGWSCWATARDIHGFMVNRAKANVPPRKEDEKVFMVVFVPAKALPT